MGAHLTDGHQRGAPRMTVFGTTGGVESSAARVAAGRPTAAAGTAAVAAAMAVRDAEDEGDLAAVRRWSSPR